MSRARTTAALETRNARGTHGGAYGASEEIIQPEAPERAATSNKQQQQRTNYVAVPRRRQPQKPLWKIEHFFFFKFYFSASFLALLLVAFNGNKTPKNKFISMLKQHLYDERRR